MMKILKITVQDPAEDMDGVNGQGPDKVIAIVAEVDERAIEMEIEDVLLEDGKATRRLEPGMKFTFWIGCTDKVITFRDVE